MRALLTFLGLMAGVAPAAAQSVDIVYDTVAEGTPAAVTCGFCGGEKFGMVFRQLSSTSRPGLRANQFPLTLNRIEVAVAPIEVSCEPCGMLLPCCTCRGGAGDRVSMMIEAYAGTTVPRGDIAGYPVGAWPGETMVFGESAELQLSVETTPGSAMFNVMVNQVMVDPAVRIEAPNNYIRVVVTIPGGAGRHDSCTRLGYDPPEAVAIRDGARIEDNIGFIYSAGGIGSGWFWNESPTICDTSGNCGIDGDWLIRLNVTPMPEVPDAGMSMPDAGMAEGDAGSAGDDAGMTVAMDAAAGGDAGASAMCSADGDCAGGERCVDGACQQVSCAAASDCAGGMTCVEGMCRNLCSGDAECRGGEVCDTAAGHCAPVSIDAGCGCRAVGGGSMSPAPLALLGLALVMIARRRRQRA